MKFLRKPQTDAEIIENTRKALRLSKWVSVFQIAAAALMLCYLLPKFILFLIDFLQMLPEQEQYKGWAGFMVGLMIGVVFMLVAAQAIHMTTAAIQSLFGRRKDKLLVKCYEALQAIGKEQTTVEPAVSVYGGDAVGSGNE